MIALSSSRPRVTKVAPVAGMGAGLRTSTVIEIVLLLGGGATASIYWLTAMTSGIPAVSLGHPGRWVSRSWRLITGTGMPLIWPNIAIGARLAKVIPS